MGIPHPDERYDDMAAARDRKTRPMDELDLQELQQAKALIGGIYRRNPYLTFGRRYELLIKAWRALDRIEREATDG